MSKNLVIHFVSGKTTTIYKFDGNIDDIDLEKGFRIEPVTDNGVPTLVNLKNVEMLELAQPPSEEE